MLEVLKITNLKSIPFPENLLECEIYIPNPQPYLQYMCESKFLKHS